jgi:parvulin-like peptidyl-prolyl isomerase
VAVACTALPVPIAAGDGADDVLATVGETPITRADLMALLHRTGIDRQQSDGQLQPGVATAALERLVDELLLRAAIASAGIGVDPAEVTAAVERFRSQLQAARGVALEKVLEQSGSDMASLRRQIEFDLAIAKLIGPRVDDTALAATFQKYRRDLDGTRVRVSHIVLHPDLGGGDDAVATAFRTATNIRTAILRREMTFAEAAAIHSGGPSRHRGGDLGLVERRGEVNDIFARQAFALGIGDVSQPFATPFGVHLVTVTAVEPGTATLEVLRPQIEQLAAQDALRELVANLRKTTPITYPTGASPSGTLPPAGGVPPPRSSGEVP